jgi:hypothetical protein
VGFACFLQKLPLGFLFSRFLLCPGLKEKAVFGKKKGGFPRHFSVATVVPVFILEGCQGLTVIGIIALQVTCFPAVWPVDDLFALVNLLAAGVTGTRKLCRNLPGIESVFGMAHFCCLCP